MRGLLRKIMFAPAVVAGLFISRLGCCRGYKRHLLSTWQFKQSRKGADSFFYVGLLWCWCKFEYLTEKDPDKREAMKEIVMGGLGGRAWAEYYDEQPLDFEGRIGCLSYQEACPLLAEVDRLLGRAGRSVRVIQIGSSSGREIAWLAGRHPSHLFVGTDIYPEVIAYSEGKHRLANLSFRTCSAKEIADVLGPDQNQRTIVFSSGSLQYVQPEHMGRFFRSMVQMPALEIMLQEPASALKKSPERINGSLWRGDFSYTHNYRFYAEDAGFSTEECRIIRPYVPCAKFRAYRGTVHYYYHGKRNP